MSIAETERALKKFLEDPTPAVLCIKGRWGTGKTYAVRHALHLSAKVNKMKPERFAYLSLFGIKDLSDAIQSIFVNTDSRADVAKDNWLSDRLSTQIGGSATFNLRSLSTSVAEHASIPVVKNFAGVARAVVSNFVKGTIICVDDLERKSSTMDLNEVFGLIVQLRDERNCKIILILNENSFDSDEKATFERYSEKVINREILFWPTPQEAARIAFSRDGYKSCDLVKACIELEINNIRIIEKIRQSAGELSDLIGPINDTAWRMLLRKLTAIAWATFSSQGEGAPTLDFLIQNYQTQFFSMNHKVINSEEQKWIDTLSRYGFGEYDYLSEVIQDGLNKGYFDLNKINVVVDDYIIFVNNGLVIQNIEQAWKIFHNSFDQNVNDVIEKIYGTYLQYIKDISAEILDQALNFLRKLNENEKRLDLVSRYLAYHRKRTIGYDRQRFDVGVTDPDLIKAIKEINSPSGENRTSFADAAENIYRGGWSAEDEDALFSLDTSGFVGLFKNAGSDKRIAIIKGCLAFRNIANCSDKQRKISDRAVGALIQIGKETPLNALRIRKFGVKLPADNDDNMVGD